MFDRLQVHHAFALLTTTLLQGTYIALCGASAGVSADVPALVPLQNAMDTLVRSEWGLLLGVGASSA
jgi:hypothetical protein